MNVLERWGTPVAPRKGYVIWFGQDRRNVDRPPGQSLEAQNETDLLGITREVVVMENQFCSHRLSLFSGIVGLRALR